MLKTFQGQAQAPESMNYQAVIRDGSGDLVASQQVGLRIKILQGSASGSSVYEETYSPSTNAYGLVNLQLGTGTVQSGTFSSIDWGNGPYFVETAADVSGGTSYVTLSTTQFMSVPYALYAKNAGLDSAAVQAMIDAAGSSGGGKSFSYPAGINGTAITYDLSTGNYTVPAGKTLYILDYLAYSGVLAINGITLYSGYHNHPNSGTSTHYEQPLIADAGDVVSGPGHFNGLLVNQSITAITYDLNSGNYTVPSGKRLYIMDYYGAASNSAIFIEGLILFNGYHNHTNLGNSRHLAQPLVANAGEVVSGSHHFNGYLVDENFFESSSSGSGSSVGGGLDSAAVQAMIDSTISGSLSTGFSVRTGTANYSGCDVPVYNMNIDTIYLLSGQWVECETDISISHGNTNGSVPWIGVSVAITNTAGDEVISSGSFSASQNSLSSTATAEGYRFIKNMSDSTKMYIITGSTTTSFTSTGSVCPYANRNASWSYMIKKY